MARYNRKHGMRNTSLYNIWHSMKLRCNNPNHRNYQWYGAKGVKVCEDWLEFIPFMEWALAHGYEEGLTLDREDSNKDYEPSNCRWITRQENSSRATTGRERTDLKAKAGKIEFNGKSQTIREWEKELGISYSKIYNRLYKRGGSVEKALTEK